MRDDSQSEEKLLTLYSLGTSRLHREVLRLLSDSSDPSIVGAFQDRGGPTSPAEAHSHIAAVTRRMQGGDEKAFHELYDRLAPSVRRLLRKKMGYGADLDDELQCVFLALFSAIKNGALREPERIGDYVRTIVERRAAQWIREQVKTRAVSSQGDPYAAWDRYPNPEELYEQRTRVDLMKRVLQELSKRDRAVLVCYYLEDKTAEEICADMKLTPTQFRLLKSRAKARFGALGAKMIKPSSGFCKVPDRSKLVSHPAGRFRLSPEAV